MNLEQNHETIIIFDFGSQYSQLIARKIRELNVFSEIVPFNTSLETIKNRNVKGIVLSGSPFSVNDKNAPKISEKIFDLGIPVLGICYGLQLLMSLFQGKVKPAKKKEYGRAHLKINIPSNLFNNIPNDTVVWMSHGDKVEKIPANFEVIGQTLNSPYAAVRHLKKNFYGIQFHPEVAHTNYGKTILENFCKKICKCSGDWSPKSFIAETIKSVKQKVGTEKVICGLSGGIDSSVTAVLLHKAIGTQLHCIFVDTGLLRLKEAENVEKIFRKHFQISLSIVNKSDLFLNKLKNVSDPELKRKIIGGLFINVFEEEAKKIGDFKYLAQGTLYPDVIESISFMGPSATIKSHHNVGGLPEKMNFKLVEPLRELFKDEVRNVGSELGIPGEIIGRHPFPGPGLAVRILGDITPERVSILQQADDIFISELILSGNYDKIWQAFAVLLPVQTVGVMGDERTYENALVLRAVTSTDGMTANWYPLPYNLLGNISNRIINEVRGINRVVYDISSKPPATIEWE
ncbi:glutamine-hydrolyzing GMP synthase [Calditrichota bacterium]